MHKTGTPMIHRDIKPENIMISNDTAVIIDFGLAVFLPEENGLEQFAEAMTLEQTLDVQDYLEKNEYRFEKGRTLKLD